MKRFMIEQSNKELFTSHSGLALVGLAVNRFSDLEKGLQAATPLRHGISHGDLAKSYLGLMCLGKSDFEAVSNVRNDRFFKQALGIARVPSAERLRLRFDEHARAMLAVIDKSSIEFLEHAKVPVTALKMGHVALDIDVFPMDNSGTKKEGVSRTYHGYDGYAPIGAYLGNEGWCLACELREGRQHSQREFAYVLERVIPRASRLTAKPLLLRLDGAHDALENRAFCTEAGVDFLIKWNPRHEDEGEWLAYAEQHGVWETPRPGKRVALFSVAVEQRYGEKSYRFRRVMHVTERTIDKHGQQLLLPEIEIEGWWSSLDASEAEIIKLYHDHGTSEQFHSEFKTDLDVERLPSGKFDTNDLVLGMAGFAYNILRWIGLIGLLGEISPVRHPAKRRRLRTVIQELMYLAARVIYSGRRLKLRFSCHCPGFEAFRQVYHHMASG
jgi:hypothetical protein